MSMNLVGILTDSTCGEACWTAKEEVCRCSCCGVNHGILRAGGARPERTCKMDGCRYVLKAIGNGTEKLAQEITWLGGSTYYYEYGQPRAAARLKPATASQTKWQEVQPFMPPADTPAWDYEKPDLLWVREDKLALYDLAVKNIAVHKDRQSLDEALRHTPPALLLKGAESE